MVKIGQNLNDPTDLKVDIWLINFFGGQSL